MRDSMSPRGAGTRTEHGRGMKETHNVAQCTRCGQPSDCTVCDECDARGSAPLDVDIATLRETAHQIAARATSDDTDREFARALHHVCKAADAKAWGDAAKRLEFRARAHRIAALEEATRRAMSLVDQALGDTDPSDPDHPLLRACQALASVLDVRSRLRDPLYCPTCGQPATYMAPVVKSDARRFTCFQDHVWDWTP